MAMASSGFSGHLTADADADVDVDGQTTHPGATHLNEKPLFYVRQKERKKKRNERPARKRRENDQREMSPDRTRTHARI